MKFSEMTYTRPDIDALLADCKALAAKAAAAPDGDALVAVYYEQSRAFADYTTASQLANIHYTCDTRDASWKAEQDFFDANGPAVANAQVEISRAFLSNPHVDALTEHFGTTCVAGMKNAVLGMDDRTVDLQKEFNALPVPAGIRRRAGGAGRQAAHHSPAGPLQRGSGPCRAPCRL